MNLKRILVLRRMALSMTLAMTLLGGLAMTIPARADVGVGADRNKAERERIDAWAERDRIRAANDKINERVERVNELIKGVMEGAMRAGRGGGG
ncbi:hypothetical protein [Armatimonas sp.]|uniref:hypothetical protein n=1 Tax=Armatimonas sp. TaxID=1872638 RepID=UPI0037534B78